MYQSIDAPVDASIDASIGELPIIVFTTVPAMAEPVSGSRSTADDSVSPKEEDSADTAAPASESMLLSDCRGSLDSPDQSQRYDLVGPSSQSLRRTSDAIARYFTQYCKTIRQQVDFSQPHWHYLALGTLLLSLPTGVSLAALQTIASPPKANCNQPQQFRAELAELQCLHQAMESGDTQALTRALPKLQAWPSDSPVHSVAQRLLQDWSVVALSLAHREFETGQWDSAIRLAEAVPAELALGNEEQLSLWRQIKARGEQAYELALDALEQQDWTTARQQAQTLASLNNDYWRQQGLQTLPEQIDKALQAQQPQDRLPQISAALELRHADSSRAWLSEKPASVGRSPKAMPILISIASLSISAPSPTRPEFSAA